MDAIAATQTSLDRRITTTRERDSLTRSKTLIVGCGGTGVLIATYIAMGAVDDLGVACLGIDVMGEPPVIISRTDRGDIARALEFKREYIPIGRDLDPLHLSAVLREREGNDAFRWLLEKQPGGRFIKSVEIGTEGERIYGYLSLLWSQRDVEEALRQTLKRLNDVRLVDGMGETIADTPINVVFVSSTAGGVGSSIVLAVCGMVKEAMDRLGIGVHRSLFTYFAVAADAFEETTQQLSNSYESITDVAIAQKEGLTLCARV